jgi:hypothetical protein
VRAVAQAISSAPLHAPRKNQRAWWNCGCRAAADSAKANTDGEATAICNHLVHRGPGDGTYEQTHRLNWGPSCSPPEAGPWVGGPDHKFISGRVRARGADEAIVSSDPAGQHNPPGSQGPLDGIALCCRSLCRLEQVNLFPLRLALWWAAALGCLGSYPLISATAGGMRAALNLGGGGEGGG